MLIPPMSAAVVLSATLVQCLDVPTAGSLSRQDVKPDDGGRASVRFEIPFVDIQEVWTPNLSGPDQTRKWKVGHESAPKVNMPYMAFFNAAGQNVFSLNRMGTDPLCGRDKLMFPATAAVGGEL